MKTPTLPAAAKRQLLEIATRHFHVETLETRCSDRLDFYNAPVWAIEAALEAAYLAGHADRKGGAA
jgi:hypothetical protein